MLSFNFPFDSSFDYLLIVSFCLIVFSGDFPPFSQNTTPFLTTRKYRLWHFPNRIIPFKSPEGSVCCNGIPLTCYGVWSLEACVMEEVFISKYFRLALLVINFKYMLIEKLSDQDDTMSYLYDHIVKIYTQETGIHSNLSF